MIRKVFLSQQDVTSRILGSIWITTKDGDDKGKSMWFHGLKLANSDRRVSPVEWESKPFRTKRIVRSRQLSCRGLATAIRNIRVRE
jgi:hypothetical protein